MPTLTIMRGLPGGGKSTVAADLVQASGGNTVRINKDLLRQMLHFNKWTPTNEGMTHQAARDLARSFLASGKGVIIDDTNLNPKIFQGWKDLGKELGAQVVINDRTTFVDVEECVRRDAQRPVDGGHVGRPVIANMALRYGLHTFAPDSVVLCDIDGTIAEITHRLHYVRRPEGEPKDWKGFFSEMSKDTVRLDVADLLHAHRLAGKTLIFMSGRGEEYKADTMAWLKKYEFDYWTLLMRPAKDHRPDTEVKRQLFTQHFPDPSVIHVVYDDRPSVIRTWRDLNLPVIDVGSGVEF